MIYHVLNGDAMLKNFHLEGEIVVCRECLIEGDLRAKDLDDLWKVRAEFIKKTYDADDYFEKVKGEFDKLNKLKTTDEVNLWFGNDAFCQINMSFTLWAFGDKKPTFYRVFPESDDWNCSFEDIENCLGARQKMSWEEVQIGAMLWKTFQANGNEPIIPILGADFPSFKKFDQVCNAIFQVRTEPKEILREITQNGATDFNEIFAEFRQKAGIYGFGDSQVKNILDSIL